MTLKAKLIVSTIIETVLVVSVAISLVINSIQLNAIQAQATKANEIVDTVTQIRFVTFEYLLHQNQRSFDQWQTKQTQLGTLLKSNSQIDPEDKLALEGILRRSSDAERSFLQLVDSYKQPATPQTADTQKELREHLTAQILIKQQEQITGALGLANETQKKNVALSQRADRLTGTVIIVMLLITVVNSLFITRTINRSLKKLQRGAEAIAAGQLDYRVKMRNTKDEFGRVAAAFNVMATATQQLDKNKTEFILLASHQLRTPLNAIKWYTEALHSRKLTGERQRIYVEQVHDSNERMIQLVNKLLDTARVDADSLRPQPAPITLPLVLDQVLGDVQENIQANNIHIVKKIDKDLPTIIIDPSWIQIIVQNLLANAIRYSRQGGKVIVTMKQDRGRAILISVSDTGYGIPSDQQNKIFSKLFRADNAKQVIGEGSGLDLYITKAMVDKTGGKIWFDSTENKGTVFYVRLPIKPTIPHETFDIAPETLPGGESSL